MSTCAYCGTPGILTRDHVWPECFLDRVGRQAAHFSHQTQRAHGADYVVGDVCADCNNVRLEPLDRYFCGLYDRYFVHGHPFGAEVSFEYDFDLLARALLKIAYNSARSAGADASYLSPLANYILDGTDAPAQFALYAELVSPTVVKDARSPSGVRQQLPTGLYRSVLARLLTPNGNRLHARILAIGSFYFHLLLPAESLTLEAFDCAAGEVGTHVMGTMRLSPSARQVTLTSSPQDGISSIVPHIRRNADTYESFFDRRRARQEP